MKTSLATPDSVPFSESGNLDFLRSSAVLSVAIFHLLVIFRHNLESLIWPLGRFGVLVFFVHTSLVLMMSLERSDRARESTFAPFYIRRGFRIYPLSIACIFAVLVLRIPATSTLAFQMPSLHDVLANVALVQNFVKAQVIIGPLWSLPYEVQMYLFLPIIFLFLRWANSSRAAVLVWLASYLVGVLLYRWVIGSLEEYFLPCFLAGCLAFQLSKRSRTKLPSWLWPASVLLLAIGFIEVSVRVSATGFGRFVVQPLLCVTLGALIPHFREIQNGWLKRASKQIAKYSYGIYLLHVPLMVYFFHLHRDYPKTLTIPAFLACIVALPVAAFWLIEDPMIRLGRKLARPTILRPEALRAKAATE